MKKKFKQPGYFISLVIVDCNAEIWCNNIRIFKHITKKSKDVMSITIPINSFLLSNGWMDLDVKIFPPYKSKVLTDISSVNLKLILLDYLAPKETELALIKLNTPEKSSIAKKSIQGLPYFELKGGFEIEMLPFQNIGWSKSLDLRKHDQTNLFINVFKFYQKIHSIIKTRDLNSFLELNKEKSELIFNSYYMNNRDKEISKEDLIELFNDTSLELLPLNMKDVVPVIMAEGKLINLVRKNGLSAIFLNDPKGAGEVELEFTLHKKNENSDFSII